MVVALVALGVGCPMVAMWVEVALVLVVLDASPDRHYAQCTAAPAGLWRRGRSKISILIGEQRRQTPLYLLRVAGNIREPGV